MTDAFATLADANAFLPARASRWVSVLLKTGSAIRQRIETGQGLPSGRRVRIGDEDAAAVDAEAVASEAQERNDGRRRGR